MLELLYKCPLQYCKIHHTCYWIEFIDSINHIKSIQLLYTLDHIKGIFGKDIYLSQVYQLFLISGMIMLSIWKDLMSYEYLLFNDNKISLTIWQWSAIFNLLQIPLPWGLVWVTNPLLIPICYLTWSRWGLPNSVANIPLSNMFLKHSMHKCGIETVKTETEAEHYQPIIDNNYHSLST